MSDTQRETVNCTAPEVEDYFLLKQKIDRGFNHYDLDDLREAKELEQQAGMVPTVNRWPVRRTLFSIGMTTCLLLLLMIYLQKLFRWIWFGKP